MVGANPIRGLGYRSSPRLFWHIRDIGRLARPCPARVKRDIRPSNIAPPLSHDHVTKHHQDHAEWINSVEHHTRAWGYSRSYSDLLQYSCKTTYDFPQPLSKFHIRILVPIE